MVDGPQEDTEPRPHRSISRLQKSRERWAILDWPAERSPQRLRWIYDKNVFFAGPSGKLRRYTTGYGFISFFQSTLAVNGPNISIYQSVRGSTPDSWNLINRNYAFLPNQTYYVQMLISGVANVRIQGGIASFFAQLDPIFIIDPILANSSRYSILQSRELTSQCRPSPNHPLGRGCFSASLALASWRIVRNQS
jgi:hypothetical protein